MQSTFDTSLLQVLKHARLLTLPYFTFCSDYLGWTVLHCYLVSYFAAVM